MADETTHTASPDPPPLLPPPAILPSPQALEAAEEKLDAQIDDLERLDEDELERMRRGRLDQLKRVHKQKADWIARVRGRGGSGACAFAPP